MKRVVFVTIFALITLVGLFGYQYFTINDGKLHLIFCDVGQGDAILIKTPDNKYILVDAGPDKRVLDCLSRHMPFWERHISLAMLTHPHADHFVGYYYVVDGYRIDQFATEELTNKTDSFLKLRQLIQERNIPLRYVASGDRWKIKDSQDTPLTITVVGPTKQFLMQTSPNGSIGESREFASVVTKITYGSFEALLSGDSQVAGLLDAREKIEASIDVLQAPHHGSSSGLDEPILNFLQPKLAVISVGKNRYGHPTKKVLDLLKEKQISILRTDQRGDIKIVTDGKVWEVL